MNNYSSNPPVVRVVCDPLAAAGFGCWGFAELVGQIAILLRVLAQRPVLDRTPRCGFANQS
jgi:hypothetical protein